jgi:hypothetical protein
MGNGEKIQVRIIIISMIYLLSISPCTGTNGKIEDKITTDQDWVVPFRWQIRKGIWGGKKVQSIESVEADFEELNELQMMYNIDTDVCMIGGHYYRRKDFKKVDLGLASQLIVLKSKLATCVNGGAKVYHLAGG